MFSKKKRNLMKLLCQLTSIVLIVMLLAGCGKKAASGSNISDSKGKSDVTSQQDSKGKSDVISQQTEKKDESSQKKEQGKASNASPATAGESFSKYMDAKLELVNKLADALTNNPETTLSALSFFGISMVDLALLPATFFGLGEASVAAGLGVIGAQDIKYSENGNQYKVTYNGSDGKKYEMLGEYDKAADALKCTSKIDNKEILFFEYRKTSYGYVSQIYTVNDDGTATLYQLTISENDGMVGIFKASSAPPALTGSEKIDFPKQCQEWYAIEGDKVTGVASGGKEISFVYTP